MALIMDFYVSKYDVTIPNCYWKIENNNGIVGDKNKINVRISCYKNKSIADTNMDKLMDFDFSFTPELYSGVNFIAQAYEQAKKISYFKHAVDA